MTVLSHGFLRLVENTNQPKNSLDERLSDHRGMTANGPAIKLVGVT